jgi:hypothetical protein
MRVEGYRVRLDKGLFGRAYNYLQRRGKNTAIAMDRE